MSNSIDQKQARAAARALLEGIPQGTTREGSAGQSASELGRPAGNSNWILNMHSIQTQFPGPYVYPGTMPPVYPGQAIFPGQYPPAPTMHPGQYVPGPAMHTGQYLPGPATSLQSAMMPFTQGSPYNQQLTSQPVQMSMGTYSQPQAAGDQDDDSVPVTRGNMRAFMSELNEKERMKEVLARNAERRIKKLERKAGVTGEEGTPSYTALPYGITQLGAQDEIIKQLALSPEAQYHIQTDKGRVAYHNSLLQSSGLKLGLRLAHQFANQAAMEADKAFLAKNPRPAPQVTSVDGQDDVDTEDEVPITDKISSVENGLAYAKAMTKFVNKAQISTDTFRKQSEIPKQLQDEIIRKLKITGLVYFISEVQGQPQDVFLVDWTTTGTNMADFNNWKAKEKLPDTETWPFPGSSGSKSAPGGSHP